MQRRLVNRSVDVATLQKRRKEGGKPDRTSSPGKVERLDTEPVPRHDDPTAVALVDDEREHAVKALHALGSPGMP